ncbi:hypothetical protein NA56DRAFT_702902 [Hyaloscypha hepaticicola]|uniref:1-alkyl-2-acetylglycerophosphocholine esterase n=1 Tax=Hyaloscypha hepaticicola TaxID=2082293 RepID=A0A2J6Q6M0_9HELO|nr:hypothetical protein NA56DRAFT_702902 [Hyaloscypha hepaticicola]
MGSSQRIELISSTERLWTLIIGGVRRQRHKVTGLRGLCALSALWLEKLVIMSTSSQILQSISILPRPKCFRFLLLVIPLCSGTLLPRPSGPYQLTLNVSELIDTSRKDPWGMDPTTYRRLMISRFDPLPQDTCYRNEKVPYMSPTISSAEDTFFAPYGVPAGIFASLEMGFTVITLDHPFDTDIVEFPDGFIAYGGNVNFSDINSIYHTLDIRMNDISFVLDTLGFQYDATQNASALIFGHSFGGAAAAAGMLNDTRLRGGVNLDRELFGGVINAGLGRPCINQSFILFGAEGHNRELELRNASHNTFTDLPLIADVSGIRTTLPEASQAALGFLPGKRVLQILSSYLHDFFGFVLRGNDGEGLLCGPKLYKYTDLQYQEFHQTGAPMFKSSKIDTGDQDV